MPDRDKEKSQPDKKGTEKKPDDNPFFWRAQGQRRTVRGGIRSQTARGAFGTTWWARRWIEVLESFRIGERLNRGKSYARQGQVANITIGEGQVEASVQGTRAKPYLVRISVKTISEKQWHKLSKSALARPIVAAKLLAGEMPENIEELFHETGASLLPARANDLTTSCSCPDWSNPCKHVAAVYYLLGEEFDRDPFLIFRLRGMSKEKLIELVSREVAATHQTPAKRVSKKKTSARVTRESTQKAHEEERELKVASAMSPLPVEYNDFWNVHLPHGDVVGSSRIPSINASLPKRLGNLPFWRVSESLVDSVYDVYKVASQKAQSILAQDD